MGGTGWQWKFAYTFSSQVILQTWWGGVGGGPLSKCPSTAPTLAEGIWEGVDIPDPTQVTWAAVCAGLCKMRRAEHLLQIPCPQFRGLYRLCVARGPREVLSLSEPQYPYRKMEMIAVSPWWQYGCSLAGKDLQMCRPHV